jgi:diguanylate cyclase (GGDEF)-like protein
MSSARSRSLRGVIGGYSPDQLRARVGGILFLLGALVGAISLLLPHPPEGETALWIIGALSGLTGVWWLLAGERIPTAVIYLGEAGASALISFAVLASDTSASIYAANYLWIALYSGYFFRPRMAVLQLTWLLGTYGVALALVNQTGGYSAFTRWLVTAMALAVATGMGSALVTQRRRVDAERAELARDRERMLARAESEARTDALTGVPNRRGLYEAIEREIARAGRQGRPLCLAVIDLDNFKLFNDRFGHSEGDMLLVEAVRAWGGALRGGDTLARLGGEEFVVVLPETDIGGAWRVIDRLRASTPRGETCSAGIARWRSPEKGDELIRRADDTMYEAKSAGRDRTVIQDGGVVTLPA